MPGWLTGYVCQRVFNCLSEVCVDLRKKEDTESTAERESESLLPSIPHVAQLPFKHHKQTSGVMSRREGDGGGAELREKAERKHNSNRNQLQPSKLFIYQMDTFPRDFTLKHSYSASPRVAVSIQRTAPGIKITITLSKSFHVWFISTLKSGSPSTPWSHVCSIPQAQWGGNMFSFLYLQRCRQCYDLVWRILYKSEGP